MRQNKLFQIDGRNPVKNLSAWWLPELTICREIGGTVYCVSGTYEGMETLDKKLGRILGQSLDEEGLHP